AHSHDLVGHVEISGLAVVIAGEVTQTGVARAGIPQVVAAGHMAGVGDAPASRAGRLPGLPVEDTHGPDHLADVVQVVGGPPAEIDGGVAAGNAAVLQRLEGQPARWGLSAERLPAAFRSLTTGRGTKREERCDPHGVPFHSGCRSAIE